MSHYIVPATHSPVVTLHIAMVDATAAVPTVPGDYLVLNPCDGYHLVQAHFDEDGSFAGFWQFAGPEFTRDCYIAWAYVYDSAALAAIFQSKGGRA